VCILAQFKKHASPIQQDKKAQAEQRAIQQTHSAITKSLAAAQQKWTEEEEDVVLACQEEQSGLRERLTGSTSFKN
jgi:hypothetical protein